MAAAKARLAGRTSPSAARPASSTRATARRSRDVEWAPPGGAPREVPACEADAPRLEAVTSRDAARSRSAAAVPY